MSSKKKKGSFIYESMRPYQREGAAFGESFLLADQPGLGKTIQTLATVVRHHRRERGEFWHLIFCPSVAVENVWEPETLRWLRDHPVMVLTLTGTLNERAEKLRTFKPPPWIKHVFVIVNIESARIIPATNPKSNKRDVFSLEQGIEFRAKALPYALKWQLGHGRKPIRRPASPTYTGPVLTELFEREWATIVVDESHRALIATGGIETATRKGLVTLGRGAGRRIALSGTPMRGKPEQLWGTLNWLRPDLYRSKWKWIQEHFVIESNGFSKYVIANDERGNAVFLPGARKKLARSLASIMLRRTKAEVLPDLPPKQYAGTYLIPDDDRSPLGVWLEPTPKMLKQLDMLALDKLVWDEETGEELLAQGPLAYYSRARFLAGGYCKVVNGLLTPTVESPKFEWLREWLENSGGEKIVVVSQFTRTLEVFAAELTKLGYEVGLLTGKTSDKKRSVLIDRFQNDETLQVFMLNVAAGGVALTLDAADYLVFLDETSIPDDQEQAEDRIHRASRMHNVTIYYLRMLKTLEEEVAFIAAARQNVQQYLLDGARGVETAKSIYLETINKEK